MWNSGFYKYEHWYTLQKAESEISKHSRKKIIQVLWTVATYLLKNVEHGMEYDFDSAYGVCIY